MINTRFIKNFLLLIMAAGFLGAYPSTSSAHIRNYSFSDFSIKNRLINYELRITLNDLNHIISMDLNEDGAVDQKEFEESRRKIDEGLAPWIDEHLKVSNNNSNCNSRYRGYELLEKNEVLIKMLYKCEDAAKDLKITATIFKEIDAKHMNMAKIHYQGEMRENIFREGKNTFSLLNFQRGKTTALVYDLKEFWNIGFETLFKQTNYFLFTLAILLIGNSLAPNFRVVIFFFLGHILSLGFTVLGGVQIPDSALNAVIAFSIVYLCAENCFKAEGNRRSVFSFVIGTVFGTGLTLFFTDLSIPKDKLAQTVIAYTAGIASAQLLLIAVLFCLLSFAVRFNREKKIIQISSFYIGLFSFYLFLEKVLINVL